MARYTKSSYRVSRRLGFSTLETGEELARRPYAPGAHGNKKAKKLSNYGVQLQEKQKVRFMYGLNEKQFRKVFEKASSMKIRWRSITPVWACLKATTTPPSVKKYSAVLAVRLIWCV